MSDDIQPTESSELAVPGTGEVSYEPLPDAAVAPAGAADLDMVLDVPVELTVEIGRTTMTIRETLDMGPGAIITLDKMTGEPVACATRWTGSRATATHSRPGEVALDFHLHATALART